MGTIPPVGVFPCRIAVKLVSVEYSADHADIGNDVDFEVDAEIYRADDGYSSNQVVKRDQLGWSHSSDGKINHGTTRAVGRDVVEGTGDEMCNPSPASGFQPTFAVSFDVRVTERDAIVDDEGNDGGHGKPGSLPNHQFPRMRCGDTESYTVEVSVAEAGKPGGTARFIFEFQITSICDVPVGALE